MKLLVYFERMIVIDKVYTLLAAECLFLIDTPYVKPKYLKPTVTLFYSLLRSYPRIYCFLLYSKLLDIYFIIIGQFFVLTPSKRQLYYFNDNYPYSLLHTLYLSWHSYQDTVKMPARLVNWWIMSSLINFMAIILKKWSSLQ